MSPANGPDFGYSKILLFGKELKLLEGMIIDQINGGGGGGGEECNLKKKKKS